LISNVNANITNFKEVGLQASKSYQYVVMAYNDVGESEASFCKVKMPNPPINITINYAGVINCHDQGWPPGEIKLYVSVKNGGDPIDTYLPPGGERVPYRLNNYETVEVNEPVYFAPEAGDSLEIVVLAMEEDENNLLSALITKGSAYLASSLWGPTAGEIAGTVAPLFNNKDDYVGSYRGYWTSSQNWGIGQHNAVGTEDLRIWFSIWSDNPPPTVPQPSLLPKLQSYDVSSNSAKSGDTITFKYTIDNPDSRDRNLGLGASIKIGNSIISDSANDVVVSAAPGTSVKTRSFKIPAMAAPGTYDVLWGIWDGTPGASPQLLSPSRVGYLTVSPPPILALTSYDISPSTAKPGDTVIFSYTIDNPDSSDRNLGLGASIKLGNSIISDSANDVVVSVAPGSSVKTRSFKIPTTAASGTYDVLWGIWSGRPGVSSQLLSQNRTGYLTVFRSP